MAGTDSTMGFGVGRIAGMDEIKVPRWRTALAIAKTPEGGVALLLLAHVAAYSIEAILIERAPVSQIVTTMWEAVWALPDQPLVRLGMIPLAIWLFWRGANKVERAERDVAAKILADQKAQTISQGKAVRGVNALARVYFEERRLVTAKAALAQAGQNISHYRQTAERLKNGERMVVDPTNPPLRFQPEVAHSFVRGAVEQAGLPPIDDFDKPQPILGSEPKPNCPRRSQQLVFEPDLNPDFFRAHEILIARLEHHLKAAAKAIAEREKALERNRASMETLLNGQG